MATTFPVELDVFTTKVFGQTIIAQHMNDAQDAIVALETKLGVGSVGAATLGPNGSIDYLLRSPSSTDPGHRHTTGAITGGLDEALVQRLGAASLARLAVAENVTANWVFTGSGGLAVTGGAGTLAGGARLVIGSGGSGVNATTLAFSSIAAGRTLGIGIADLVGAFRAVLTVTDSFRTGIATSAPQCALHVHDYMNTSGEAAFTGVATSAMRISSESVPDNNYVSLTFANGANQLVGKIGAKRADAAGHALYFGVPTALSTTGIDRIMVFSSKPGVGALGIGDVPQAPLYVVSSDTTGSDWRYRSATVLAHCDDAAGPALILAKTRGTFGTNATTPVLNDELGMIQFAGRISGSPVPGALQVGAQIAAVATADWSAGARDACLSFFTCSASVLTEHIRIRATGVVAIGGDINNVAHYPAATATLDTALMLPNFVDDTKVNLSLWANSATDGDQMGFGIDTGYLRFQMTSNGGGFRFKHGIGDPTSTQCVLATIGGFPVGQAMDLNNVSLCLTPHTGLDTIGAPVVTGGFNGVVTVGATANFTGSGNLGTTVLDATGQSFIRLQSPNGYYNIHGIKGGRPGQVLVLYLDTYNGATYTNVGICGESVSVENVAAYRIINGGITSGGFLNGGGVLTTDGRCAVMLIYDPNLSGGRWVVIGTSAGKAPA